MDHQLSMFRNRTKESIDGFVELGREQWLNTFTSQHCLAANQTWWTSEVFTAFDRIEQGNENAMKDYCSCVRGSHPRRAAGAASAQTLCASCLFGC